jgi:hypothetical protein
MGFGTDISAILHSGQSWNAPLLGKATLSE